MTSLSDVVKSSAPIVGSVLNSFLPGAGLVVNGLMSLFGVETETDLISKIKSDPDSALKLAEFELEHKYDLDRIIAGDRDSARNRNIEVTKATGKNDSTLSVLAYIFVIGFFIYSFLLFFVHIDSTAHDIVLLIAGQISSMAITVAGFFFGSMFKTHSQSPSLVLPPPAQTR